MMKTLQRAAPVIALLMMVACSESATGPDGPQPPTAPTPEPVPVARVEIGAPSDTLTLSMLADTTALTARAFAADGTEVDLWGRTVTWTSGTPETMKVTPDGGAWLWPEDENDLWAEEMDNGGFRFRGERGSDSLPMSPGPQNARITLTVDGVSGSRDFIQTSPFALWDVSPTGFCRIAEGTTSTVNGQEFTADGQHDIEVDTRDRWGRAELSQMPSWSSADEDVVTVTVHPDDPFRAIATVHGDGSTQILMTLNGWTAPVVQAHGSTVYEDGRVKC